MAKKQQHFDLFRTDLFKLQRSNVGGYNGIGVCYDDNFIGLCAIVNGNLFEVGIYRHTHTDEVANRVVTLCHSFKIDESAVVVGQGEICEEIVDALKVKKYSVSRFTNALCKNCEYHDRRTKLYFELKNAILLGRVKGFFGFKLVKKLILQLCSLKYVKLDSGLHKVLDSSKTRGSKRSFLAQSAALAISGLVDQNERGKEEILPFL